MNDCSKRLCVLTFWKKSTQHHRKQGVFYYKEVSENRGSWNLCLLLFYKAIYFFSVWQFVSAHSCRLRRHNITTIISKNPLPIPVSQLPFCQLSPQFPPAFFQPGLLSVPETVEMWMECSQVFTTAFFSRETCGNTAEPSKAVDTTTHSLSLLRIKILRDYN